MKKKGNSADFAKFTPPSTEGVLPRERLHGAIDQGSSRLLTWICGPAGSGKTTLVSSYLAARGLPALWLQLERTDRDPATFFYYLGRAARRLSPRRKKDLPYLTPEFAGGIGVFARNFFEELFQRLGRPAAVVFDDYQEIGEGHSLDTALLEGISRRPEGVSIVVVSRSFPPPAFARLGANHQMTIVGWDDLRLTRDEFARIAGERAGEGEEGEAIYRRVGGWAAGVRFLAQSPSLGTGPSSINGRPEALFDYFAGEVFERLDVEMQQFLLKTSVLGVIDVASARHLTGVARADRILADLHRSNYFTERRGRVPALYRYHPLFREFLLGRAREHFPPEEMTQIQRNGAGLLLGVGQPEAAAGLLRDAGDWDELKKLVRHLAPVLVRQGRHRSISAWLQGIPPAIVNDDPWMQYWLGVSENVSDPRAARRHLKRSFTLFCESGADRTGKLLSWSGVVDSIVTGPDDFSEADSWITSFYEISGGPGSLRDDEASRRASESMYAALVMRRPRHPDFSRWRERVSASTDKEQDRNALMQALGHMTFSRCYAGESAAAELLLERMRRLSSSADVGVLARLRYHFTRAFFGQTFGHYEPARRAIEAGIALAEESGVRVMDQMFLSSGARLALNRDDVSRAREMLNRMGAHAEVSRPWNRCFYNYMRAALALREGDLVTADRCSDLALGLATSVGVCYTRTQAHLLRAEVAHERGDSMTERTHLQRTARLAGESGSVQFQVSCRMAEAHFRFDRGDERGGTAALEEALRLSGDRGGVVPYLSRPPLLAHLCLKALEANLHVAYVRNFIVRCGLVPEVPPQDVETWPWPLKIRTMGTFGVTRGGEEEPGDLDRRSTALLKELVATGGKAVGQTRLIWTLWPDADGEKGNRSFSRALQRLRQQLGVTDALLLQEGKLSVNPRLCWVDVWAFDRLCRRAEAEWAAETDDPPRAAALAARALDLYGGAFLGDDEAEPSLIPMRERLREKFARLAERLGEYYEGVSLWDEAAALYERVVAVEPLVELGYQGMMRCRHRQGDQAGVESGYHLCRETLRDRIGVPPSQKTEDLYRRLGGEGDGGG